MKEELKFEITTAKKSNFHKKTVHQYSDSDEVMKALLEFQKDPDIYIWHWQAGMPHSDYEHFYEV
jgi:hypothetical protein